MDNENLWHLRNQIFEDLSHETVLKCRRVCKYWNESLRRMSDIKFIQEFGDRDVGSINKKVSTIFCGWKNTVQKYGFQADIEYLEEVKDSLKKLARGAGKCCAYPVHEAAKYGDVKLIEFILRTSYNMNNRDDNGFTAWHWACINGRTETAQLIIEYSKDFGIDLNAKDNYGKTAWHETCINGRTETAQLIIQSSTDYGINMNAKDEHGFTAFHKACYNGRIETAQLIIHNSKDFGIDLNAKDNFGNTALHKACFNCELETVHMILKNREEYGIDIKAQDNDGRTALDLINHREGEKFNQIKKMLEREYSMIDFCCCCCCRFESPADRIYPLSSYLGHV